MATAAADGDVAVMLQLLSRSLAADADADKQLDALHRQPLSAAFVGGVLAHIEPSRASSHVPADVRLLACLWLKQYLKRSWKQLRHWSDAERTDVRQRLLVAALQEPTPTLALHLALSVAIVARSDFPSAWTPEQLFAPVLLPLQTQTQDAQPHAQQRSVELAYRVVKELSTRRLLQHRKQFAALSVELLPLVLQHWSSTASSVTTATAAVAAAAARDATALQKHLLTTTKLLATLLLHAFRELVAGPCSQHVHSAFVQFYEQLERLLTLRSALLAVDADATDETAVALLDRVSYRIARVVVETQKAYAIEFRALLTPFLELFWRVLAAPVASADAPGAQRLQREALQFLANVWSCRLYKRESLSTDETRVLTKVITASGDVALSDAMVLEANAALASFFDGARIAALVERVVLQFMRLQPSDLDDWRDDPEAFVTLSESLTAAESLRVCAENLFLTLLEHARADTIPVLTRLTATATEALARLPKDSVDDSVDATVLDVDAVLLALGLGCYDLHECFDFEPWFLSHLVPLLVADARGLPVLRARVVWLVSCWLAQLSGDVRVPLYDALLCASAQSSDAALQRRVLQTLEAMLSDWGFDADAFLPFLPRAIERLVAFFPQARASDSKLKVLACLEALVTACGPRAATAAQQLCAPLPAMWQTGGEAESLVRAQILQLLAALLRAVKTSSHSSSELCALHEMSLQVIALATDVRNPDELFLMESGLELWLETVASATQYSDALHALFPNAVQLLDRDLEHVQLVLSLLERYVRLGGAAFWQTYHADVQRLWLGVVGNVKLEAARQLARTLELVLALGGDSVEATQALVASCAPVLQRVVAACVAFQRRDDARESHGVITAYLGVVARLWVVASGQPRVVVVDVLQGDLATLLEVLELWLHQAFTVAPASLRLPQRKLWAAGLCGVLDVPEPPVLEKLGQILEACVEVADEEAEQASERAREAQALLAGGGRAEEEEEEEEEDFGRRGGGGGGAAHRAFQRHHARQRESDVLDLDVDLLALAKSKLSAVAAHVGPAAFAQLLQSVDASVLQRLER
ncbi:hypothetical protein PINS_up012634 [Pythium insidiosum]|nr:hypothetical protein PINS_up012634 [Pythium insidiosum]